MNIEQAIRERRSVGRVKDVPLDRKVIEKILEAGNWAPSHHATEPWRFYVMTGRGRDVLASAYADIAAEQAEASTSLEDIEDIRQKQAKKAYRAPLVIAVAVSPSSDPKVERKEEFAAAHAAVQNMLLRAHALGLGAIWRSGQPMFHPIMKRAFQLKDHEELVALVYIGEPAVALPEGKRRPVEEKTVWIEQ
ncbi:nitroreductase [Marinicrinis lubricantis]|uniref:Putative NAD(P)H nitroreductase n=1 Tax=Marinicrinis lubricantis TaxID=2086470 RepID=A0ABW1IR15_9BACL